MAVEDVSVGAVWEQLKQDPAAVLVDVRTRAEWAFVGVPDLAALGKRVLTVEWQSFPDSRVDPGFAGRLGELLAASGTGKGDPVFFICRSGGRSRMAAEEMAATGFVRCSNVADGFEGPLDQSRQRGKVAGWKAAGLPWVQG
ncbi:MAG: rhodanese-like domain-containing protein [Hyphomicrobium sp.]